MAPTENNTHENQNNATMANVDTAKSKNKVKKLKDKKKEKASKLVEKPVKDKKSKNEKPLLKPKSSDTMPGETKISNIKTDVKKEDEIISDVSLPKESKEKCPNDLKKQNGHVSNTGSKDEVIEEKDMNNMQKKSKKSKKSKSSKYISTLKDTLPKSKEDKAKKSSANSIISNINGLSDSGESAKNSIVNNTFSINDNWDEPLKEGETEIFVPNPKYSGNKKVLSPDNEVRSEKKKTPKKAKLTSDEVYGTPSIKTPSKPPTPVFLKKAISKSEGKGVKDITGSAKSETKKLSTGSLKKSKLGM